MPVHDQRPRDLPQILHRVEPAPRPAHQEGRRCLQRIPESFRLDRSGLGADELPPEPREPGGSDGHRPELHNAGGQQEAAGVGDPGESAAAILEATAHRRQSFADAERTRRAEELFQIRRGPIAVEEREDFSDSGVPAPADPSDQEVDVG